MWLRQRSENEGHVPSFFYGVERRMLVPFAIEKTEDSNGIFTEFQ
jgi:hypothetical protein